MRFFATLLLSATLAAAAFGAPRDAGALFAQFCADCHGAKGEGGKGTALRAALMKHGTDAASLHRSIAEGFASAGMPGFAPTFAPAELNALVVLVREQATQAVIPNHTEPIDPQAVHRGERHAYRIETVVDEGLQVPWSFVFLPDGRILLTERAGRLRLIVDGRLVDEPVAGVPSVIERDEGGLMALALAPDYATSGWIYLSFSDPGAGETAMTKIVRGRLRDNRFTDVETVFAVPLGNYQPGYVGFGSRLAFRGADLFFTVGERGAVGDAQRLDVPNGKIHRVRPDGSAPPDNPFVGRTGAIASIWSYGHRNPQGLAIDPRDGAIWSSEHGPRGGDELNRTDAGDNCGWPLVTFGMNYDGTPVSDRTEAPGLRAPVRHWTPSIAVSQIAFYTGDRFPGWRNNLFVGSLARQTLYRLEVEGRNVRHEEEIFRNLGRIRDIKTGPDGLLYVLLEQLGGASGRLVRLVPAQ